jgi:hypothetical protein
MKEIQVSLVDISLLTAIRVDCERFEEYFIDSIEYFELKDSISISRLSNVLSNLELIDDNYPAKPDTRIKIRFKFNKEEKLICIGKFVTYFDSKAFKTTEELRNFSEEFKLVRVK